MILWQKVRTHKQFMWSFASITIQKTKIYATSVSIRQTTAWTSGQNMTSTTAHTLPVLSSHISLVCGYHTEKHCHVTQVHVSRSAFLSAGCCIVHRLLQRQQYVLSQQLYTQFRGASLFSAKFLQILKANIPQGMACSLPVPRPSTMSSVRVLSPTRSQAMKMTVDSVPMH